MSSTPGGSDYNQTARAGHFVVPYVDPVLLTILVLVLDTVFTEDGYGAYHLRHSRAFHSVISGIGVR